MTKCVRHRLECARGTKYPETLYWVHGLFSVWPRKAYIYTNDSYLTSETLVRRVPYSTLQRDRLAVRFVDSKGFILNQRRATAITYMGVLCRIGTDSYIVTTKLKKTIT